MSNAEGGEPPNATRSSCIQPPHVTRGRGRAKTCRPLLCLSVYPTWNRRTARQTASRGGGLEWASTAVLAWQHPTPTYVRPPLEQVTCGDTNVMRCCSMPNNSQPSPSSGRAADSTGSRRGQVAPITLRGALAQQQWCPGTSPRSATVPFGVLQRPDRPILAGGGVVLRAQTFETCIHDQVARGGTQLPSHPTASPVS